MTMGELVVVTGGAGFIGSHLAKCFARNGYSVRVVDNLSTGDWKNLEPNNDAVEYRNIDIRDLSSLTDSFREAAIVLHHAGISSVPRSFADWRQTHEVNVTGTLNVLLAASRVGVRKVINASSSSVYGNNGEEVQKESAAPAPLSPYGLSKWMSELYAAQFAKTAPMEIVSLRYFNVFGPRQSLESGYAAVIPLFIQSFGQGIRPIIFGDGSQTRDFTFVDNVVEANLRLATSSLPSGTTINVATGCRLSLNELVRLLSEIFDTRIEPIYQTERAGDIKHSRAEVTLSEKLLGKYNTVSFRDGLQRTADWFLRPA
jgi:UDP-N-acetylglucosamine/UDP-N-acetyl-alpha-D-glucosaminouronate 4-epimerase